MGWILTKTLIVIQEFRARFHDLAPNGQCAMIRICGESRVFTKPGNQSMRVNILTRKALTLPVTDLTQSLNAHSRMVFDIMMTPEYFPRDIMPLLFHRSWVKLTTMIMSWSHRRDELLLMSMGISITRHFLHQEYKLCLRQVVEFREPMYMRARRPYVTLVYAPRLFSKIHTAAEDMYKRCLHRGLIDGSQITLDRPLMNGAHMLHRLMGGSRIRGAVVCRFTIIHPGRVITRKKPSFPAKG
jgi:hypothetical protein